MKRIIPILLVITMLLSACKSNAPTPLPATAAPTVTPAPTATPTSEPMPTSVPSLSEADFLSFTDEISRYVMAEDSLSLHFSLAHPEDFDVVRATPTLGSFSAEDSEQSNAQYAEYLDRMQWFRTEEFSDSSLQMYDSLYRELELTLQYQEYSTYLYEPLGPSNGLQVMLPIDFSLYEFYTKSDIDDYLILLADIDRLYADIETYEKEKSDEGLFMSDDTADSIIDQMETFVIEPEKNMLITYFNERIEAYDGLTTDEISAFKAKNKDIVLQEVIPAYQSLIDTLTDLKGTGTNSKGYAGFEDGADYYALLFEDKTGCNEPLDDVFEELEERFSEATKTIMAIAQVNPDATATKDDKDYPETNPKKIIDFIKDHMSDEFPELPEIPYDIAKVDLSLQEALGAVAMYIIPPKDISMQNHILVNPSKINNENPLYTTLAHEAYPGHLYQTNMFRRTNPYYLSELIGAEGYKEGWAMYAEIHSYEYTGWTDDEIKYNAASTVWAYTLYALLDIGINYKGWSNAQTRNYLQNHYANASITDEIFAAMVSEPCLYPSYGLGYLEFEKMRDKAESTLGNDFDAVEYHRFLLDMAESPFDLIDKWLDRWLIGQGNANAA